MKKDMPVDPFASWKAVKESFQVLKTDLDRDGDKPVIPVSSWEQIAKETSNLIAEAAKFLSEIPVAQQKAYKGRF